MRSISTVRLSLSKWYHPSKTMAIIVSPSPPDPFQEDDSLAIFTRLPSGFKVVDILSVSGNLSFTSRVEPQPDLSQLITIDIALPNPQEAVFHLHFRACYPLFETFETIGGGGEELMGLSRTRSKSSKGQVGQVREMGLNQVA